ncbi:hypothetical protein LCGC14_1688620, partial [marine sediment metagenome]
TEMLDASGKLKRDDLIEGEATTRTISDKSRPVYYNASEYGCRYSDDVKETEICGNFIVTKADFPYTKKEEEMEISTVGVNNRLMISELNQKIHILENELCSTSNNSYSWCNQEYYCSTKTERTETCVCISGTRCYYETCGSSPWGVCQLGVWVKK